MAVQGYVFDVTEYTKIHPGGKVIKKGFGKQADKLYSGLTRQTSSLGKCKKINKIKHYWNIRRRRKKRLIKLIFNLTEMKKIFCLNEIKQQIKQDTKLGVGAFSQTYKIKDKNENYYAVKIIYKKNESFDLIAKNEVNLHRKINHPNIIKFIEFHESIKKYYIVLEYAEKGDLFRFLQQNVLSEQQQLKIFYQTCLALNYIHERDIMHRDLKPENILLDKNLNIKICDFGWSVNFNQFDNRQTVCGTYEYMAPEILLGQKQSKQTDVWSLGILLYEIYHKKAPFQGLNLKEVRRKVFLGQIQFKQNLNIKVRTLIQKILKPDQLKRIKLKNILKDSLFKMFQKRKNKIQKKIKSSSIQNKDSMLFYDIKTQDSNNVFKSERKIKVKKYFQLNEISHTKRKNNMKKNLKSNSLLSFKVQSPMIKKIKFLPQNNTKQNKTKKKLQNPKHTKQTIVQQKSKNKIKIKKTQINSLLTKKNLEQSIKFFQYKQFPYNKLKLRLQKGISNKNQKKYLYTEQKENKFKDK